MGLSAEADGEDVSFPLADWILGHPEVPHNLALSGMRGSLRSFERAIRERPEPDAARLRAMVGRLHGVRADRVFLTHGATEANSLVLLHLARERGRKGRRAPRLRVEAPEYPPLLDTAALLGFQCVSGRGPYDAALASSPRNPIGTALPDDGLAALAERGRPLLLDQTFREFTRAPAATRHRWPNLFLTGSFTKIYGADELRIGYAIPPAGATERFGRLHGLLLDLLPHRSLAGGIAVLEHRAEILAEARALFRRNLGALRDALPEVPELAAPVWFDRGSGGLDGDRFQAALLRAGVLVCSGSFFGAPDGVRICLTRASFPNDLEHYLTVRRRFVHRS